MSKDQFHYQDPGREGSCFLREDVSIFGEGSRLTAKVALMIVLSLVLLENDKVETEKGMKGVWALQLVGVVVLLLEAPCGPSLPIMITRTIYLNQKL